MNTAAETATIIRQQITPGVLLNLGAQKLGHYTDKMERHSLVFTARVLPFNVNGERGERPRIMRVMVTLNESDTYDIRVDYQRNRRIVRHFEAEGIYADQLASLMLSIDSDDDLPAAHLGHLNRTL